MNLSSNFPLVWFQGDLSPSEHERRLVLHQQQRAHYYHRVCKCECGILSSHLQPFLIQWTVQEPIQCIFSIAQKLNGKAVPEAFGMCTFIKKHVVHVTDIPSEMTIKTLHSE